MALDSGSLAASIISNLDGKGFDTSNMHARNKELIQAISEEVVSHIKSSAEVSVTGGSSSGVYKVE